MALARLRVWIVAGLALAVPVCAAGQTLSANLGILAPLVGKTWTGSMKSPDGQRSLSVSRTFQVVWDGSVVKYSSSTPEVNSVAEGFFFWDREAQKVAVFIVNDRGIYQRGFVSMEEGALMIQGTISFPERSFEYRNTFEMTPEDTLIDRWFQNAFGPWRPGHVVELTAKK